jgi:osmotically inducible protein OsmC
MALSAQFTTAGTPPARVATTATAKLDKTDAGFTVTNVHLEVTASVPGATEAGFQKAAGNAKKGCPISHRLNTEITMTARLGP